MSDQSTSLTSSQALTLVKLASRNHSLRRFILVSLATGSRHEACQTLPWTKRRPGTAKQRAPRRSPRA